MRLLALLLAAMLCSGCSALPRRVPSQALISKRQPVIYLCAQDVIPRESVKSVYLQPDSSGQLKAFPIAAVATAVGKVADAAPEIGKLQAEVTRNTVRRHVEIYVSGYTVTNVEQTVERLTAYLADVLNNPFNVVVGGPAKTEGARK